MTKKEFQEHIDIILNSDTPEKQRKEINKLWTRIQTIPFLKTNIKSTVNSLNL
jgi:hypothetical protein